MHGTFQLWKLESTLKVEVRKTNGEPGEVLPRVVFLPAFKQKYILGHKLGKNVSES